MPTISSPEGKSQKASTKRVVLERVRADMRRLFSELKDLRDFLDLADARQQNRGKPGRPIEDVMMERGLLPENNVASGRAKASRKAAA